ncbi:YceI family protein [uncultured Draconibacterium sp.]|uniref:YceI family protein n=1 Tax=uncultured Draconibacterium sp. TaxID=1573823 RepID=UPI0025E37788|nr:YceI family protein [uncultured Draconibacterium sp.]
MNKRLIISMLALLLTSSLCFAQVSYQLNTEQSKLLITGTSSIHDWEMVVEKFSCVTAISALNNESFSIESIDFSCLATDIKSDKKIMDNKTHKALNADEHPKISFTSDEGISINQNSKSTSKGKLKIAGVQKEVELEFLVPSIEDDRFKVSGKIPIKMSDFGIEPPTAMMGTLKTGNEVTILFDVVLQQMQTSKINE